MFLGRIAIVIATQDVAARSGDVCPKFNGSLRLFGKFASSNPSSGTLQTISSEVVPCFNTREQEIEEGEEVVVLQTIDEIWITSPCCEVVPSSSSSSSSSGVTVI